MKLRLVLFIVGIIAIILAVVFHKFFPGISSRAIKILLFFGIILIILGILFPTATRLWGKYINPNQAHLNPAVENSSDQNGGAPQSISIIVRQNRVYANGRDFTDTEAFQNYLERTVNGNCSFVLIDDYASSKMYYDVKSILKSSPQYTIESEIPIEQANEKE